MPAIAFTFLCLFLGFMPIAWARDYDTYRADYFKGAFCSAIGGACAADNDMITGLFQNPASLATGEPAWDFDGDYASRALTEPGVNGNSGAAESFAVGGLSYSTGRWGIGLAFIWRRALVDSPTSILEASSTRLNTKLYGRAYSTQIRVPFALYLGQGRSVGATISLNKQYQELSLQDPTQTVDTTPSSSSMRFEVGGLFPLSPTVRMGSWFRFPINLPDNITFSSTSNGAVSYQEDFSLHAPWIWGTGSEVELDPLWSLFLETDLIGPTPHGYLFSYKSFSASPPEGALVEKGRSIVLEPHAGARHKLSDKIRLHMGSYYENPRWEKTIGRLHGTGGVSYQLGKIVELIVGIDVARKYSQLIFTFR